MTAHVNGIPLSMAGWFDHVAQQEERSRIVYDGWRNCGECDGGYWTNDDGQVTCQNCLTREGGY